MLLKIATYLLETISSLLFFRLHVGKIGSCFFSVPVRGSQICCVANNRMSWEIILSSVIGSIAQEERLAASPNM